MAYSIYYFPRREAAAFYTIVARIAISGIRYAIAITNPSRSLQAYEPITISIHVEHPSLNGNGDGNGKGTNVNNGNNTNGKNGVYIAWFVDRGIKGEVYRGSMPQGHIYNLDEPTMFLNVEDKKCLEYQYKFNEGYMAAVNTLYSVIILNQTAPKIEMPTIEKPVDAPGPPR